MSRRTTRETLSKAAGIGKRVGGSVYIHKDALPLERALLEQVHEATALAPNFDWNVAKIGKESVSLLLYESFDVAFPALLSSNKITPGIGKSVAIDYRNRANPPILHRKELLLPPTDPRLPKFKALTAVAEEHGLFNDTNRIGTREAWNALIAQAGLKIHKSRLVQAGEEQVDVARHRTAIVRRDLSQPMQLMLRFGIVTPTRTLFDYGCGQGEDVAALSSQGFHAFGWDPHHATAGHRGPADVVNLGFVLNVIEDPRERLETLKSAWCFAERALCVAVIRQGKVSTAGYQPYRDGILTSRGTFQKYFQQQELQDFVATATGQKPLALAPGIVAVFRDKNLEQEVLLRRHSRMLFSGQLPRPPVRDRPIVARPDLRERLASFLDGLRAIALPLGRLPEPEEASDDLHQILAAARVSWPRAVNLLRDDLAADQDFNLAREIRRSDLLVHLALMQFPGSPKYRSLPRTIQNDIKAFFKSHADAQQEGRRLLFAAGDRAAIKSDIDLALTSHLGGMRADRWFRFRSSALSRLPPQLRVLVGCAEVLQGGVEACDFVDIDLETPRISMITCDDIENAIPFVTETVTVDLTRLRVSANKLDANAAPIYFKSRFLALDDDLRDHQLASEALLAATGLFDPGSPEPPWSSVESAFKTNRRR